ATLSASASHGRARAPALPAERWTRSGARGDMMERLRSGRPSSEQGAEGELQLLDAVKLAVVLQRLGPADDDRADRRLPLQGDAGAGAHLAGLEAVGAVEHVAVFDEGRDARAVGVE